MAEGVEVSPVDLPLIPTESPWIEHTIHQVIAAGSSVVYLHPLDLVKIRMQLDGERGSLRHFSTFRDAFRGVYKADGISGYFVGLSAGFLRQLVYTATSYSIYTYYLHQTRETPKSFLNKTLMATGCSILGSFVTVPIEVAIIRLIGDRKEPKDMRQKYSHPYDAISRTYKKEGVKKVYNGGLLTVMRGVVVTSTQLSIYPLVMDAVRRTGSNNDVILHIGASLVAALPAAFLSLPIDVIKTRYQYMIPYPKKYPYNDVNEAIKTLKEKEGWKTFWRGFTPYYLRLSLHTAITFLILRDLHELVKQYRYSIEIPDDA